MHLIAIRLNQIYYVLIRALKIINFFVDLNLRNLFIRDILKRTLRAKNDAKKLPIVQRNKPPHLPFH